MAIKQKLTEVIKKITGSEVIKLDMPDNPDHGDYATNVALIESKRQSADSRELAKEYLEKLLSDSELQSLVEKIEIAGPGFLNFFLKEEALISEIESDLPHRSPNGRRVVVEYSSPNIAKRFSVGHFRSTVIGQAIYNLQKEIGNDVYGLNHIGDWGTQFGVILAAIEDTNSNPDELSLDQLEKLYVDFSEKIAEDETYKDKARNWFKKLEEGDTQAREIWQKVSDVSIKEFEKLYRDLDVQVDETRGESFYEDKMPGIIEEAKNLGLAKEGERGALIVELDNMPPGMLLKSDGTTTYFTRDLAAIKYRVEQDKAEKIIYEVGSEQILHFRQVFAAARKFSWGKEVEIIHIPHGLIRLPEGKMSTRKGNTIKLEELISEALEKSKELNSDTEVYKSVAIGALKYNDLKRTPEQEIVFSWDEVLNMQGNSGPYLQYTFARTQSVLAKGKEHQEKDNSCADTLYPEERRLMFTLSRFQDIVTTAAETYSPNILCNYLFNLSQEYNTFYNAHKIVGSKKEDFRLWLTKKTGEKIKKGLELLGIHAPQKM